MQCPCEFGASGFTVTLWLILHAESIYSVLQLQVLTNVQMITLSTPPYLKYTHLSRSLRYHIIVSSCHPLTSLALDVAH